MQKKLSRQKGFTLIELLVVIGIIAVLATIILVAVNPARQFAQARNTQRSSDLNAVINAIGQRIADNKGIFETGCTAGVIPTTATNMANGAGNYDIGPCLVSNYLSSMPFDPKVTAAHWTSATDYDTQYTVVRDATTGRITVAVPVTNQELGVAISLTR